jgi:hypothetical protein
MFIVKDESVYIEEREAVEYTTVARTQTFDELVDLFGNDHLVTSLIGEIRDLRAKLDIAIGKLKEIIAAANRGYLGPDLWGMGRTRGLEVAAGLAQQAIKELEGKKEKKWK